MSSAEPAAGVLVVTQDAALQTQLAAVCAAADVEVDLAEAGQARGRWASAAVVVVGVDQVPAIAELRIMRRAGVFVVGTEADFAGVCEGSVQLGAAAVTLPVGARWLGDALAEATARRSGRGRVVALVGGSGGLGLSTLAVGLALGVARGGGQCLVVDLDALGGGLDLLVGAERLAGWRWPRLRAARGQLGDLHGQVIGVDGFDLLAMGRGGDDCQGPTPAALQSVLDSARRSHDLVLLDTGRGHSAVAGYGVDAADATVLVAAAQVRGVAAARELLRFLDDAAEPAGLVVRRGRRAALGAAAVADGLGLPLLAELADEPGLTLAAERGEPPGRAARSPLARTCDQLLDAVSELVDGRAAVPT